MKPGDPVIVDGTRPGIIVAPHDRLAFFWHVEIAGQILTIYESRLKPNGATQKQTV